MDHCSNGALTQEPELEVVRIQDELSRCGLHPRSFYMDKVSEFIDVSLQRSTLLQASGGETANDADASICKVPSFEDSGAASSDPKIAVMESVMHDVSMQVFCDLKSGKAFDKSYRWPDMPRERGDERIIASPATTKSSKSAKRNRQKVIDFPKEPFYKLIDKKRILI